MEEEQNIEAFRKVFTKYFREKRIALNLTQEELAEKANIDDKHYGKIERGNKLPGGPTLVNILLALKFSDDEKNAVFKEYEEAIRQLNENEE